MIVLYQELVPRKLNWLSRYPALERYVELQVLTYIYQCHSAFGFKVVKQKLGNYICETCNFTAHAFPVFQRKILKTCYWFPNYS